MEILNEEVSCSLVLTPRKATLMRHALWTLLPLVAAGLFACGTTHDGNTSPTTSEAVPSANADMPVVEMTVAGVT